MRSGGYTVQHSLTSEAASIVKQAIALARRRGHAQVTPLHVASAMLTSSVGLLRKACLQYHSHPLQCKALELCFNVALNRLPTSQSSPILGFQSHYPSLSNALVAAFKRAQAHQRRGSIENQQQQPILALKIEVEQLVISILDDPSVSRVMREAGFSSTQVKNIVEQSVSLEICSQSPVESTCHSKEVTKPLALCTNLPVSKVRNEDITIVIDSMMNRKRKNTVVIGECLSSAEALVRGVIDRFENGNHNTIHDLRFVQFVSLPLYSLNHLSREDVDEKVKELRSLVKSYVGSRGVVLYLGDLKLISDFWSTHGQQRMSYYSPVEHMIMEVNRLIFGVGDSGKLWLMGIGTFETYMRCKSGHPSLETLWDLYPLTVPGRSLDLSLNLERDSKDHLRSIGSNILKNEYTTNSTNTSLPSWLQQCKEESKRQNTNNDQEYDKVECLYSKWNTNCKDPNLLEKDIHHSFSSPSISLISPLKQHSPTLHQSLLNWPVIFENNHSPKEHNFFVSETKEGGVFDQNFNTKPDLLSNPNSSPNSASSSEMSDGMMEMLPRFKEVNSENIEIICNALEKRVPWQSEIVPEIANTILQCRSGMMSRKGKEETWLFFLGSDNKGKEKIARELSRVVFGSKNSFISMGLSSFSSATRDDSTDQEFSNKRVRDEKDQSYLERFADIVRENPSRVFFMEDVDHIESYSQKGIKKAIENGRIMVADGESVLLKDAIVIFSCESFSSVSRSCSPSVKRKHCKSEEEDEDFEDGKEVELETIGPCTTLDLNIASGNDQSVSDFGILDSVDKQVIFKIQKL